MTVLVGNNVANIAAASVVTALLLGPLGLSSGSAITGGTLVTSVFVLVLGEIAPKSYAVSHSESWSLRVARPLAVVQRVASPIVYVFGAMTDVVNRFTGGRSEFEEYLTCDDIEAIVTTGAAAGVLDPEEEEMLQAVFDLGEVPVTAAMVPRANVIGVSIDASPREVRQTLLEYDLSRVPVYGDSQDDVRGVVHLRDALRASDRGQPIREVLTPTLFVPEPKPLDELLAEIQENRVEMAVVIDEYGAVEGIVAAEDVVEEVVGEIVDRGERTAVQRIDDRTGTAVGRAPIVEVNDVLDTDFPEDGPYATLAGFVYAELGGIAEEGDVVEYAGLRLTVERIAGHRIRRIRIERPEAIDDPGFGA